MSDSNMALPADRAAAATQSSPQAVLSKADIPSAISTAELQIGSVTLIVHQLDNGQRIIDAESFHAFWAAMGDGSLILTPEDSMKLAKVVRA